MENIKYYHLALGSVLPIGIYLAEKADDLYLWTKGGGWSEAAPEADIEDLRTRLRQCSRLELILEGIPCLR